MCFLKDVHRLKNWYRQSKKKIKSLKIIESLKREWGNNKISWVKVENTQGIWILYDVLLTLNFLNANEQKTIAAERHSIMESATLN